MLVAADDEGSRMGTKSGARNALCTFSLPFGAARRHTRTVGVFSLHMFLVKCYQIPVKSTRLPDCGNSDGKTECACRHLRQSSTVFSRAMPQCGGESRVSKSLRVTGKNLSGMIVRWKKTGGVVSISGTQ